MKKTSLLLVLAALLLSSPARAAFDAYANFDNFFTVGSDGSTTEQTVFGFNETPWLYVKLPATPGNDADYSYFWEANFYYGDEHNYRSFAGASGEEATTKDFWIQPVDWETHKLAGEWTIGGFYAHSPSSTGIPEQYGQAQANFTVTPEPASMALFGLGAGLLGLKRLRRKKI